MLEGATGPASPAREARDLANCVRCGSCKAFCPTYTEEHTEPMSARGRLALLDGLLKGYLRAGPLLNDRLYSCTLCGICETLCPTGVAITEAIYHGRALIGRQDRPRRFLRSAIKYSLKWPTLSFKLLKPLYPYLKKKGLGPFELQFPERPLRGADRIFKPLSAPSKGRVAVFTGCAVNFLFPSLGRSLIGVLSKAGYEVILPPGEVCCGSPLRAMGLEAEALELAKRNLHQFERLRVEAVLSLCPTCTLTIKHHYPTLAGRGIENAMDVSEFLVERQLFPVGKSRPASDSPLPKGGRIFYHDPCHLASGLGIREQPRLLLRTMGYEVAEPSEPRCCGFSLSMTHRGLSEGLLKNAFEGADAALPVVTSCPGCMLQIGKDGRKVLHLISLL